jgi:transcriptional repressor of cell division inhibition gene dicB
MRTQEAIDHFGSQKATAKALGIQQPSVATWGEYPPDRRQLQIERVTKKILRAEPGCFERANGLTDKASA